MRTLHKKSLWWLTKFGVIAVVNFAVTIFIAKGVYDYKVERELDVIGNKQEHVINDALGYFNRTLGDMNNGINLIYHNPSTAKALNNNLSVNQDLLDNVFTFYGNSLQSLLQVRWLDSQGYERARVDVINDQSTVLERSLLQRKAHRYYFQATMRTRYPTVYFSPIDLNVEHGVIQTPHQATIRVGLQTGQNDGMENGALIVNYDLNKLLARLRAFNDETVQLQVIDVQGNWLLNPNKNKEWGKILGHQDNVLPKANTDLWTFLHEDNYHKSEVISGELITFRKTDITSGNSQESSLFFVAVTPKSEIDRIVWLAFWPVALLTLSIIIFIAYLLCRDFKFQRKLYFLNETLAMDKIELEAANSKMLELLDQQHQLQNDLIESGKLSALGMMVAGVAHELNTPIGAALMAISKQRSNDEKLQQLLQQGLTKSALDEYLQQSNYSTELSEKNLKRSVELIKSFKRLAIDRVQEELVHFGLHQVTDDLIRSLSHKLKSHSVVVKVNITEECTLFGYPGIISQVLQNLIINVLNHAFKHEQRGVVNITASKIEGNLLQLILSDNGVGVDENILPNIFEPFVTNNRSGGNTGLGLHFVHQWVTESLKGSIKVSSTLGKGTTFIILVPCDLPHVV
ncbi:HAMP domain-containing sensor histidine kinase [Colwellia sp. E2M01]|uniref:sensor histidine kinase n=1 Tax=Colwellia sp. E2M01 TaxID=2841561 RepID=UPI001C0A26D6|nr:HAMP domain-containing sensor histidine kinase [Colwellia sp. E2M01]MBU2870679.1 HAMP domain-containing histidine kinase [Colwellia sp. E2M01]